MRYHVTIANPVGNEGNLEATAGEQSVVLAPGQSKLFEADSDDLVEVNTTNAPASADGEQEGN